MTPVRVSVVDHSGRERGTELRAVPGSPEFPLSPADVRAKARKCLRAAGRDPALADVTANLARDLPALDAVGLRRAAEALAAPPVHQGKPGTAPYMRATGGAPSFIATATRRT